VATSISVREARSRFAELLERARRGETISITRRGEEIASLGPPRQRAERQPGRMRGRIWMAPDFDEPLAEIAEAAAADLDPP
jgi:prevent-host-death family protein